MVPAKKKKNLEINTEKGGKNSTKLKVYKIYLNRQKD